MQHELSGVLIRTEGVTCSFTDGQALCYSRFVQRFAAHGQRQLVNIIDKIKVVCVAEVVRARTDLVHDLGTGIHILAELIGNRAENGINVRRIIIVVANGRCPVAEACRYRLQGLGPRSRLIRIADGRDLVSCILCLEQFLRCKVGAAFHVDVWIGVKILNLRSRIRLFIGHSCRLRLGERVNSTFLNFVALLRNKVTEVLSLRHQLLILGVLGAVDLAI